jgi:hypothetical protein
MKTRGSLPLFALLAATLVTACGGGDDHKASVSQLPPSITYPTPSGYVVGASTTPLTPTISGTVSAFTVEPPLPAGMEIAPSSGAIFGTPTAVAPTTIYRVEGRSGNVTVATTVTLTVRDVVPEISYANASRDFEQNVPIQCIVPTLRGGAVVTWSIDRALPAGLQFDLGNGQICGTPTAASPRADYVVTATNTGGSSSATLAIAVLAMSSTGGATSSFARQSPIEAPSAIRWWRLAVDGSYVAAATDAQLIVRTPTGEVLFSRFGRYGDAIAFAAPGELRIGAGAAGVHAIETIAVPAGIARISVPYLGSFHAWSEDGETFIATAGDSVWIYPRAP